MVQVTVPGGPTTQPGEAETKATLAGRVSTICTPVAVLGPALAAVSV
jgi:hypothetical protein